MFPFLKRANICPSFYTVGAITYASGMSPFPAGIPRFLLGKCKSMTAANVVCQLTSNTLLFSKSTIIALNPFKMPFASDFGLKSH